jgi:hypothetical protein
MLVAKLHYSSSTIIKKGYSTNQYLQTGLKPVLWRWERELLTRGEERLGLGRASYLATDQS